MRRMRMRNAGAITIAIGVALLMLFAIPSALAADTVTINEPSGGNWSGTQTIKWSYERTNEVDPADHENFSIHWSTTGEDPWTSIIEGLGHNDTTYSWNTAVGDHTNYTINVTKTNSSDHDNNVSGVSGSVFRIDNTAPVVVITTTGVGLGTDDVAHTKKTTLDFSGTITDTYAKNITLVSTDDGTITGSTWTVTAAALSAGCNVITATGFDYANNSGTDTVTVCHSPAGLAVIYPTATPVYQPPADGLLPLSIIPEEGIPEVAKKLGVIAVIAIVLFVVWRGSGSKPKRRRRK